MDGDRRRQPANRNCYRLSRVSWALAQISCYSVQNHRRDFVVDLWTAVDERGMSTRFSRDRPIRWDCPVSIKRRWWAGRCQITIIILLLSDGSFLTPRGVVICVSGGRQFLACFVCLRTRRRPARLHESLQCRPALINVTQYDHVTPSALLLTSIYPSLQCSIY